MKLSIQPCTGYQIQTKSLSEMKDMYISKELNTYDVWLQRLKQTAKWQKDDWYKARSYLFRLFTSGSISKSIFTVVDINLLINKIEERMVCLSKENIHLNIFEQMVGDLQRLKEKGCKYILLDGQNRLEYAIKRFYQDNLEWQLLDNLTKTPKKITFIEDGSTTYDKQSFTYQKLTSEEKNVVDDIKVIFAEGKAGEIDDFIDDLIDDNSGEHWNTFEKMITNLKTLPYLVNSSFSGNTGNIPEFKQILDKTGSLTGDYHIEKKGYHKILCELTQLERHGTLMLDYEKMWDGTDHEKITKSFQNVKLFFKTLAKGNFAQWGKSSGNKNMFPTKEMLRCFYMITQILRSGVKGYTVPLSKINHIRFIYDDYVKFDGNKRCRVKNKDEFHFEDDDPTKASTPLPGTYIWSMKDIGTDKLTARRAALVTFTENNIERWISNQWIKRLDRNELSANTKRLIRLEAFEDPFSVHNETLDPLVDNIHVDHIEQFGRGGSNDISNLQATTEASNLSRVK
jgi:hypothetical protein